MRIPGSLLILLFVLFAACDDSSTTPEDNGDNKKDEDSIPPFFMPGYKTKLEDNNGNTLEITVKDSTKMLWSPAFWDTTSKEFRSTYEIKVKQLTGNFPEYHKFGFVQNGNEVIFGAQRHPLFKTNYFVDYYIEYFRFDYEQPETTIVNKFKKDHINAVYKDSIIIEKILYSLSETTVNAINIKHISSINSTSGKTHAEENYVFSKDSSILEFWNYTR